MLEIRSVSAAYGRHQALDDVSLTVAEREVVVILGANGAGKSTLLKTIARLVPALPGATMSLEGMDLGSMKAHEVVQAGIALVPEGRGIFGALSVQENLMLGAFTPRSRDGEKQRLEQVLALFPKLEQRLQQRVQTMSGGEQQMVAIGRALMSNPRLLLLDEPSLGLAPIMTGELFKAVARVREMGVSVLMVEQNARKSLAIADRAYLIGTGRIVGAGTASEIASDSSVQEAYLGGAGVVVRRKSTAAPLSEEPT